jgi:hypothetical protein
MEGLKQLSHACITWFWSAVNLPRHFRSSWLPDMSSIRESTPGSPTPARVVVKDSTCSSCPAILSISLWRMRDLSKRRHRFTYVAVIEAQANEFR